MVFEKTKSGTARNAAKAQANLAKRLRLGFATAALRLNETCEQVWLEQRNVICKFV